MQIERVEELCLRLLSECENPLMSVRALYEQCVATDGVGEALTEDALLQFLRGHADIMVVEGVDTDAPVDAAAFDMAGIVMGPRAILKNRVPTRDEMKEMFGMQIAAMRENLLNALERAKKNNNDVAIREIEAALEHTDTINERLQEF